MADDSNGFSKLDTAGFVKLATDGFTKVAKTAANVVGTGLLGPAAGGMARDVVGGLLEPMPPQSPLPSGELPKGTELLTTPEGRSNLYDTITHYPRRVIEGTAMFPKKFMEAAQTPGGRPMTEEETLEKVPVATEAALMGGLRLARSPVEIGSVPKPTEAPAAAPEASLFRKILAPQTVAEGQEAAAGLRKAGGVAARDTAITEAALAPLEHQVNSLPPDQQLGLLGYMEGRSKGVEIADPKLQTFADEFRDAMKLRADKIGAMDKEDRLGLINDYVTHLWKDPTAARVFASNWASKQGSGKFLKERSIPTIDEGIQAGLVPATTNPMEIALRYVTAMDKHIAMKEFIESAETAGTVKFFKPGSREIPQGWQEINGYFGQKGMTKAYAPEAWAHIYNGYVSRGIHGWGPAYGQAYNAFRNASNITTQTVLGLSQYHVMAMSQEAILSQAARAASQVLGGTKTGLRGLLKGDVGEILRGGQTAAKGAAGLPTSLAAPVSTYLKGKKFQQVYLDRTLDSPKYRPIVDLFEQAGGRAVGKTHAPDFQFSTGGSYFTAWRRGRLKMEMRGAVKDIIEANNPAIKAAKTMMNAIGRTFESISDPLFKEYIPALKSGAFYDNMKAWLEANPQATYDQQLGMARKIVDSVDDRFGEMIQDNIFWGTLAKQVATIGMLSYSWNLGTFRALGGGAMQLAKSAGRAADITSPEYRPNAGYVVAFPMVIATINGIYQYLKTGKPPESAQDLMAGQTGGTAPGFGGKTTVPERALMPGYEKDVFGWYYNRVGDEVFNKLNPFARLGYEAITKKDWRGDPIIRPDPTVPQWLQDYFNFVVGGVSPISIQRMGRGEKVGSGMGGWEELLGIRPAPPYLQDPGGYARGMSAIEKRDWQKKLAHDKAQKRQYGGPTE